MPNYQGRTPFKKILIGKSSTATKLESARTISLSGFVTGSASFDGSANVTINTEISTSSLPLRANPDTDYGSYRFRNIAFGTGSDPTSEPGYDEWGGNGSIYIRYS